jgi:plastocyanin
MVRRGVLLLALGAVLLAHVACSEDRRTPTAADLEGDDATPDHIITVGADGFDPPELTVTSGDIIVVVNDGDDAHSLSSADGELDTGMLAPGDELTLVLREPAVIEYEDRVGDTGNEGRIAVTE